MISREELYELVWSQPMTKVAKQFHVSGSFMARVCTQLNIPRPARGYWAKLAVGKAPDPIPLPEPRPGDQLHWGENSKFVPQTKPRRYTRPKKHLKTAVSPNSIHALVKGAKRHFLNSRSVESGSPLKPYKKLLLDVTATESCLDKALNFANLLFNALDAAGHRVMIAPDHERLRRPDVDIHEKPSTNVRHHIYGQWSPLRPTVVYVGTVAIGLSIIEMSEEVLMRYVRGKYVREADFVQAQHRYDHTWTTTRDLPTNRLRLIAFSPYGRVSWSTSWSESSKKPLDTCIKSILKRIESEAIALVGRLEEADRQAEIRRHEWQVEQEKARQQSDRKRVDQSISESKQHLSQIIQQWSEVRSIHQFLAGIEQGALSLSEEKKSKVLERLALAREFLGTQDPMDFFMSWKTPDERYTPMYTLTEDTPD